MRFFRTVGIISSASVLIIGTLAALPFGLTALPQKAQADSLSDLQKQQQQKLQEAAQKAAEAKQQAAIKAQADAKIQQLSGQINQVTNDLQVTKSTIASTNSQIDQKNQDIAQKESELAGIQAKQNALLREMYIQRASLPDILALFSNQPVSEREKETEQFAALKKSASELFLKTTAAKQDLELARSDLMGKSQQLSTLQDQQDNQRQGLADFQQSQAALRANAAAAMKTLQAQAAAAQAAAAQLAAKISVLVNTKNWGGQIVSSDDGSWYYTQTGNYTHLGHSYETVNDAGCLITSIAMVSTYYGVRVDPSWMATHASFSGQGYYYWGTPSGLGARLQPSGGVNWSVVQREVAAGRPVIVSVYLSQVGAVNSDGSSHYIVIKGYVGGKYLMHDPIGDGRGYNLNQVRSMILTSQN